MPRQLPHWCGPDWRIKDKTLAKRTRPVLQLELDCKSRGKREAFPKAIYPGEIPGSIPIGFRYSGFLNYNSKQPVALGVLPRTDIFVPNTFTIISAGSFGQNLSFWVDNDISAGGANSSAGLGDGYLKVNDLGRFLHLPKDALNLRFGQFELDLPFTQARGINPTNYDIYDQAAMAGTLGRWRRWAERKRRSPAIS